MLLSSLDFTSFGKNLQLPLPINDSRNIGGIFHGVLKSLDVQLDRDGEANSLQYSPCPLPKANSAVVVIIDGLGIENLLEFRGHAHFIGKTRDSLVSTCPSTTATALTAFGTAYPPALTGMLGYSLRDRHGKVFSLISWNETVEIADKWQTQSTLAECYGKQLEWYLIGENKFSNPGLTTAAFRGFTIKARNKFSQRAELALEILRSKSYGNSEKSEEHEYEPKRKFIYIYWGQIDKLGHHHGYGSRPWVEEIENLNYELDRIATRIPPDTLLVVSADHGMINPDTFIDLAADKEVNGLVELVAGEGRALHLYCKSENQETLRNIMWQRYGGMALISTTEEIVNSGIFGYSNAGMHNSNMQISLPVAHKDALGQVILFSANKVVFGHSKYISSTAMQMPGVHGSITKTEMLVPLLCELT